MTVLRDHTSTDCQCEQDSQHHGKEAGMGHGKVMPEEVVILAVFEGDKHDPAAMRLTAATFKSSQLNRFEVSLARLSFTTRSTFDEKVVQSKRLVGISSASARVLRSLPYIDQRGQPPVRGRAVCLIDKVLPGDHDGHAALGWSESWRDLTHSQKGRAVEVAKSNIVKAFGRILSPDDATWMAAA